MTTTPLSTIELETGFLRRDGNPVAADLIEALASRCDALERLADAMAEGYDTLIQIAETPSFEKPKRKTGYDRFSEHKKLVAAYQRKGE